MRWLRRSVLLCLVIVVVTPARADAWFEWLDRLSGPGYWLGTKIDVRVWCFGKSTPFQELERKVQRATLATLTARSEKAFQAVDDEWTGVLSQLQSMDAGLNILRADDLASLQSGVRTLVSRTREMSQEQLTTKDLEPLDTLVMGMIRDLRHASVAIGATGIFISVCPAEKRKSFGVELGATGLRTRHNREFAQQEPIYLTTFTAGLSYRLPFSARRDIIDVGTNVGVYRYYSKGFEDFSGWTIEPFFDVHAPTEWMVKGSTWQRVLGRFSLRTGLVFFPSGIDAEQFGSPEKEDISGSELNPSLTIFFRIKG